MLASPWYAVRIAAWILLDIAPCVGIVEHRCFKAAHRE